MKEEILDSLFLVRAVINHHLTHVSIFRHTFTSLVTDTERLYSIERHFSITQFLGSRDLFLPPSLVSGLGGGGGGARREEEGRYGEQVFLTLRVAKNDAKQFF